MKKGGDIRYVVFIAGVIDKTSIIYRWSVTEAMKRLQQNQLAYTHSEHKEKTHYMNVNSYPTTSQQNMKKLVS